MIAISYSLTGNNQALAKSVAEQLKIKHYDVKENKKRNIWTIAFDLLFNRTPKVLPEKDTFKGSDTILFFGPIWIGSVATPLRQYLKSVKRDNCKYAFISISGGADNSNPKIGDELEKITGKKPEIIIDMHIADLLPENPKPTREITSA